MNNTHIFNNQLAKQTDLWVGSNGGRGMEIIFKEKTRIERMYVCFQTL